MSRRRVHLGVLGVLAWAAAAALSAPPAAAAERRFLYVATPGIRNYVDYGGIGVIVFDIDNGHRFVRRFPTWRPAPGNEGQAGFPNLSFLQLLFGYRDLDELRQAYADCWYGDNDTRAVLTAMFPKQSGNVLPII